MAKPLPKNIRELENASIEATTALREAYVAAGLDLTEASHATVHSGMVSSMANKMGSYLGTLGKSAIKKARAVGETPVRHLALEVAGSTPDGNLTVKVTEQTGRCQEFNPSRLGASVPHNRKGESQRFKASNGLTLTSLMHPDLGGENTLFLRGSITDDDHDTFTVPAAQWPRICEAVAEYNAAYSGDHECNSACDAHCPK